MLKLGPVDFCSGRAAYLDSLEEAPEPTAKVFVKICLERQVSSSLYAQIDTGAAWSVLDPMVAENLGLSGLEGEEAQLDTRFGRLRGKLVKLHITFLADQGIGLDTYGTFFISPDWPVGRTFLGYSGMLDALRFALDPRANHFYFGV